MGTFNAMAYALGAIAAPFSLISAVLTALAAIPYIGFCFSIISSLAGLYALVLDIMAVKGVNRFGWGPAIGAVLIPWLAIVFVIVCIAGLALLALGPAISDVFQQIQQGITPY